MAGRRDIEAGRAFVRLHMKDDLKRKLGGALASATKAVSQFATVATGAMAGVTAALTASVTEFAAAGAELNKLSVQTGASVEELSQLQFAAKRTGVDTDDLSGSIEELNIRLGEFIKDGTGPAGAALEALGLSAQQLADVPVPERLGMIGDALRKVKSNTTRGFLADEIFGGDAFKILPLLDRGSEGIAKLTAEADKFGATMSTKAAASAAEFTGSITKVKEAMLGASRQLAEGILQSSELSDTVNSLADAVAEVDWKGFGDAAGAALKSVLSLVQHVWKGLQRFLVIGMTRELEQLSTDIKTLETDPTARASLGADADEYLAFLKEEREKLAEAILKMTPLEDLHPDVALNEAKRRKGMEDRFKQQDELGKAAANLMEAEAEALKMIGGPRIDLKGGGGARRRTLQLPDLPGTQIGEEMMPGGLPGIFGGKMIGVDVPNEAEKEEDVRRAMTPSLLTFSAAAAGAAGFIGGDNELAEAKKQTDELQGINEMLGKFDQQFMQLVSEMRHR